MDKERTFSIADIQIMKKVGDANKEMNEYEKKLELQMKGLHPMVKEDAVKGMAPGQVGGMIGASSKDMGGRIEMIGQDLAPKNNELPTGKIIDASITKMQAQKELKDPQPMMKEEAVKGMAPGQMGGMIGASSKDMGGKVDMIGEAISKDVKVAEDKKGNMPEAIAKKVDPEVKKIVDSFGKPAPSEVEQKKMEAMKQMGVEPPKDAKDMEDLRKGIYRPEGKEIPGTGVIESLIKDLQAFGSMLGKLAGGKSGYTSGEMFGSTNFLVLIALVAAIIIASRR